MSKSKDNEPQTAEIRFTDFQYGDQYSPMEWLQFIASELEQMANLWDDYDSNYIEEAIKAEEFNCPTLNKIEIYAQIASDVGYESLNALHIYIWENSEIKKEIEQNRENIVKAFSNSVIYPNLLNIIGIIEIDIAIAKGYEFMFWYSLYFSCFSTAEEAEEYFCRPNDNLIASRFKNNPKLTMRDYEIAFGDITECFEELIKRQLLVALKNSLLAIRGYCELNGKNYNETQRKIAERYEKAYRSYQYAEEKTGNTLTDSQAYDYLKKHAVENIEGFMLPDFNTWQRYVRAGRRHYGTRKTTPRAGREIKSSIPVNDPDVKQITSKFDNPESTETD